MGRGGGGAGAGSRDGRGRRGAGDEEGVDGEGAGGGADERVDVEGFDGVAQVAGQAGQAGDGVGDRAEVGGGLAAAPGQHRGDPEPAQRRQRGGPGDRGEKHGPFGQNLDENAAGPDDQEGTERGVPDDAQGQFGAWRGGLGHHHPRAQAGGQVVVGGAGLGRAGQAEPDPADVGLVRDARLAGLDHDRVADLVRGRQGRRPGRGGPAAHHRDAVVAQQAEQVGAVGGERVFTGGT